MAMVLSSLGAAYGIAKSGIGISAVSVLRPDMMVRSKELPFSKPPGHLLTTSQIRSDATNSLRYPLHIRPRGGCDHLFDA
jgi:hypothetical protein